MERINLAVDLTWLVHNKVGGTEAYTKNLIDGFVSLNDKNICYYLLLTKDNYEVFKEYDKYKNIKLIMCPLNSARKGYRVFWQNIGMSFYLKRLHTNICVEPVYLKPFIMSKNVKFITTIHDLQAAHYPQYFSKARVLWMKLAWKHSVKTSEKIIVTSNYVKQDIMSRYRVDPNKICINYDPVVIDKNNVAPIEQLNDFGVEAQNYYYMCSSLLPHKNIDTIIRALGKLKRIHSEAFVPLVISGIGGKAHEQLEKLARENGIENDLHITPFISEKERNLLYKNCKVYLAPSLFEGFGMTPIEAMIMGAPVLTTKETCSYEITGGIATYVEDARNADEWCEALETHIVAPDYIEVERLVKNYSKENIAEHFNRIVKELNLGRK